MNDEEIRELLEFVKAQLRDLGENEIADEDRYAPDDVSRDASVLSRRVLIDMLSAFDRTLAIQDRSTYNLALVRINEHLGEHKVSGAEVLSGASEAGSRLIDLSESPYLTEIRTELRQLIEGLWHEPPRERYR